MQYRKIMSMLLILVLVAPWLAPAGKVSAGASYPVPGNNGLITVKGVDDNSVEVKWEYAQSDNTASYELSYRVFFSKNSDLTDANEINNSTVDHSYGNWISGSESTDGSFSRIVTNLTEGETYYFNVIVQDRYSDFAYQMQSIEFTTPLGEFNNSIGQNFDATKITELFKNENFITTTPEFESLPLEEQNALVTLAGHMNEPANGYESNSEVQFLVDYIQQGISVMKANELSDVQERLTTYYDKTLTFAASVSSEYLNMIKPMLDRYFLASDLEQNVLAFKIKLQRIANNPFLEESVMNLSMASSQITNFTNVSTQSEMINALTELYQLQEQAEAFKGTDKETLVGTFPLDFSKMKSISSNMTEMEKLADWMLLKKPGNGYLTYKVAQEAFDEFFGTPEKQSLKQLNAAIDIQDKVTVLSILKNTDLLNQPGAFSELTDQEQKTVAATLVQMTPRSGSYNEDQVQFIVDISINILLGYRLDYRDMASALNNIYDQVIVKGANLFSEEEFEQFKKAADFYLKANQADQQLIAYIAKFTSVATDTESAVGLMFTLSEEFPSINQAETASEILNNLNLYQMLQMQYQILLANNPGLSLQESPLKFDQIVTLSTNAEQQQLAEWMLSERPVGGYEKIKDIQRAFDLFFAPPAPNVTADDTANVVIGADETMEYSKDNGETWNKFTDTDRFEGNQIIVVRVRAKGNTPAWKWTTLTFTSNTPTPNPGGSTGGGGSTTTPVTSTPAPTTKQEQIVVDVNGANGTNLTKTPITRTTETNGTIKDLVKMTEAIAKESVEKAKQLNMNTARIVIPDTKDAVSETRIELPRAAVKELNDGSLKLEISTENVVISVPTNSIVGFDQDLYFRVVPLKKESERIEVEERAKKEQLIQQVAPNTNVRVLARPVEIETNMQSREVMLTLPLRDSLPTDPAARQQALDNLAIYIEHSDGTKELIQGKLVQFADNSEGIEFTVTKFSTFTLVVVDGLKASQSTHQPYIQGFGADFRPDAFVTRAQMAAMLARNLSDEEAAVSTSSASYKDVSATHWAASEIQKAQSAGIMNGMSATQFAPEGSITRAQMATIAYRWMQQQQAGTTTVNGTAVSFTDVSADLWAVEAIAYVQSAGLMVGYNDGTFKPDSKLTRAEAVKVLNVLFNRTPLTGAVSPTFGDVPATHWAYADIEAAAQK
ncbi:DUF4073 domain-containing protein [Paenibacillus xylanexedens]|uniref:DUF4073 domain-containing protein n=1 Tax=Paenibacillus xylanexedens TaxID=528191 RepID=UPI0011AAE034|nr:DUF4073 domain-containing protein [Paenibacillus xylanexedens]